MATHESVKKSPRQLLVEYQRSLHIWHTGYDQAASYNCRKGRFMGVGAAIGSAVVATSAFASLSTDSVSATWKLVAGFVGATAAVLATLNTSLQYQEHAVELRKAANLYATVRHQAEILELKGGVTAEQVEEVEKAWKDVREAVPMLTQRQYDRAERRVKSEEEEKEKDRKTPPQLGEHDIDQRVAVAVERAVSREVALLRQAAEPQALAEVSKADQARDWRLDAQQEQAEVEDIRPTAQADIVLVELLNEEAKAAGSLGDGALR